MNLRKTILEEHSRRQCLKIVAWVGNDKKRFAELMKLMLHDEYRVAQRAAYPVGYCVEEHPELIRPWFSKMIKRMQQPDIHDAVRRNTLKTFEDIDIPEKYCGTIFELCNRYLHDMAQPVAVRAISLTVMSNIANKFPDLKNEVRLTAESLLRCGIPALETRSKRSIREMA